MKITAKFTLLIVFTCLIAHGCTKNKPDIPENPVAPEYSFPQAEYHKAGSILMYTPGDELFDGVIHPAAGLYETYFNIDEAADEHRNYISMLEAEGCTVHTVANILLSMPHDELVALADGSLTYDVAGTGISPEEAEAYRQEVLAAMSNSDLLRVIINRPTVVLEESGINTGYTAEYIHNPLMNMYFLRDQSITTPKGHIMCRMNSAQRFPEVDIIEACYGDFYKLNI